MYTAWAKLHVTGCCSAAVGCILRLFNSRILAAYVTVTKVCGWRNIIRCPKYR